MNPVTRIACVVLSAGVAWFAALGFRTPEESRHPDVEAFNALNQAPPDVPKAVRLDLEALRGDLANPYRWTDLGGAYEAADEISKARYCFQRALELSGDLPPVWLRDANFHFDLNEPEAALGSAARVLKTVPDYDAVLFGYFDRFDMGSAEILREIGENRRATRAFTLHLIDTRKMGAASEVWNYAFAKGFVDEPVENAYVQGLLAAHRYADARRDWVRFLGSAGGEYPERNLLFNGGFERESSGSALDWRVQPSADFNSVRQSLVTREGSWAMEIRFHGSGNVSYANVVQEAVVTPGRYELRAWVRTEGITTNECPTIELVDAESPARFDQLTASFCGSKPWTLVTMPVAAAPGTNLLAVRVVRHPSSKFDNKIDGVFWIDGVSLTRK